MSACLPDSQEKWNVTRPEQYRQTDHQVPQLVLFTVHVASAAEHVHLEESQRGDDECAVADAIYQHGNGETGEAYRRVSTEHRDSLVNAYIHVKHAQREPQDRRGGPRHAKEAHDPQKIRTFHRTVSPRVHRQGYGSSGSLYGIYHGSRGAVIPVPVETQDQQHDLTLGPLVKSVIRVCDEDSLQDPRQCR